MRDVRRRDQRTGDDGVETIRSLGRGEGGSGDSRLGRRVVSKCKMDLKMAPVWRRREGEAAREVREKAGRRNLVGKEPGDA